jgi:hypothetical protein
MIPSAIPPRDSAEHFQFRNDRIKSSVVITIPFMVLVGPFDLIAPLEEIKSALRAGKLQTFVRLWGRPANCHAISAALLGDLDAAGRSTGWVWCRAVCLRVGVHSWLECSGTAFDASNVRPVLGVLRWARPRARRAAERLPPVTSAIWSKRNRMAALMKR